MNTNVDDIYIYEDFIDPSFILDYARSIPEDDWWAGGDNDFWNGRFYNSINMPDDVNLATYALRDRITSEIEKTFGHDKIYSDLNQIVRWFGGYELQPHADSENPVGHPPHEFPYRQYASITYLNDDFVGGEIYFPNKDFSPVIKPGMTVFFPGTLEYLHGVREVTEGVRYTCASFYTTDERQHREYRATQNK